jgi:hypothetical protein
MNGKASRIGAIHQLSHPNPASSDPRCSAAPTRTAAATNDRTPSARARRRRNHTAYATFAMYSCSSVPPAR